MPLRIFPKRSFDVSNVSHYILLFIVKEEFVILCSTSKWNVNTKSQSILKKLFIGVLFQTITNDISKVRRFLFNHFLPASNGFRFNHNCSNICMYILYLNILFKSSFFFSVVFKICLVENSFKGSTLKRNNKRAFLYYKLIKQRSGDC